nr:hypothetical protein [Mycobacterium intermedium]
MLQTGSPAQISSLARAFHEAGRHTADADAKFDEARRRFEAAWNRQNGDHPINDADEVQRATRSLGVQAAQLPKIAVDLESLAASLAEAQRTAGAQISELEKGLEAIDRLIGDEHDSHVKEDLKQDAAAITTHFLHQLELTRDRYAETLHDSMTRLRTNDGYDASLLGSVDGYDVETPDQAEKDVHAALAGDQAAAARINAVLASITEEQVTGKKPLGREQASVLSQLQAQQHGMSVDELVTAEGRLGDQRSMIGDSWQLMSNPAIVFPRTELKPGAKQGTDTVKGGAEQLPESIHGMLDPHLFINITHLRLASEIVSRGNPALQRNTELDRGLLRKASAMMDIWFGINDPGGDTREREPESNFDPAIATALRAVSPDHQVVHDTLTGLDRDPFLKNVTHHVWLDGGKNAASLFSWTESAAHGPEAIIAGETAHTYADYLGKNQQELLRLPGNHTLGEKNPELVRGMAHGLIPYVGNIAGISGALPEFGRPLDDPDIIDTGTMPIAKGVVAVLSTDADAGAHFNGAAYGRAVLAEGAFAQAVIQHDPDVHGYNQYLHEAATLRGLVDTGIHIALQADVDNHHLSETAAQNAEYDHKKSAYELNLKIAGAAAGLIPHVGAYTGPLVGILGSMLEDDFVGKTRGTVPLPPDHGLPNMSIGFADREILNTLIAFGQRVDGISQYMIDGYVATPHALEDRPGFTTGAYDHALNRALARVLAQIPGNDLGKPPDAGMIDRYNNVVTDAKVFPKLGASQVPQHHP